MTRIRSNGSKWAGERADPVGRLFVRLGVHTLDPMFEEYGNFRFKSPRGSVRVWGNFFDVSAVFDVETDDPALGRRLLRAIRANQRTPAYRGAADRVKVKRALRTALAL